MMWIVDRYFLIISIPLSTYKLQKLNYAIQGSVKHVSECHSFLQQINSYKLSSNYTKMGEFASKACDKRNWNDQQE